MKEKQLWFSQASYLEREIKRMDSGKIILSRNEIFENEFV